MRLCLLALVSACASQPSFQQRELEPGVIALDCAAPLGRCSEEAERLCRDQGYDVLEGHDARELYGHEAGESRVEVRSSRLVVSCRKEGAPRSKAAAPPAATSASPSRPLVCTPGGTQRCVGPAACDGGQSCLPDGSGYGACDCGPKP